MELKAFKKGGIHPEENKFTAESPINKANMPKIVRIPMQQHLGAPAKLLVAEGDIVVEGQLIGEAVGFVSANIHTSVSGKVVKVEKANTLTAKNVDFVVIETGGSIKNWHEKKYDYKNMSGTELLEDIKKAGVVGLGGATFPTHVKLSPPKEKKVSHLIVNGAECEPYLTIDHRLMLEKTDEILEGIAIIQKILLVDKVSIGIEENKEDAIEAFNEKVAGNPNIEVVPLRTRYPQGGEKQLIQAICRKDVPSGGLPMDIGVVVENISTILAIYEAVVYKKPLIERGLTYTGDGIKHAGNYKVRIGTTVGEILKDFEAPAEHGPIISGGPMMGLEITDPMLPVTKGTSGIVILSKKKDYKVKQQPCIRCTRCIMVCPIGLEPTTLGVYCDGLLIKDAVEIGLLDCIECGSCAYVCPSTIPLVGLIRYGKDFYKRQQAKK